jgi:xanthine dehydrogenase accessory factor
VTEDVFDLAVELRQRGEPFALATVVRCEPPTSAKPGAKALVRPDGTLAGWVGGACAEPTVIREALAALRDGEPRLLSLVGEGGHGPRRSEGVREYPMTCHSGGTLEIYVEPCLPRPRLVLIGRGPVLETLAALARSAEYDVITVTAPTPEALAALGSPCETHLVVATHGDLDESALAWGLTASADSVSLVASRRRAAHLVERLARRGIPGDRLEALKAPAGLDIGAVTPAEIAVSILAEVVQSRRRRKPDASIGEAREERDPVCGMVVDPATARYRSDVAGGAVYFCCAGCKARFDRERTTG